MKNFLYILLIVASGIIAGCAAGGYSFTGGSVGDAKTINIKSFPNRAPLVEPTLSNRFTEALKDRFVQQSSLSLTNGTGDMQIDGEITGYTLTPQAVQSGDLAARTRLTITVKVKYTNTLDDSNDFEQNFSRYSEYDNTKSLDAALDGLLEDILSQLTEDIYNKALVNW